MRKVQKKTVRDYCSRLLKVQKLVGDNPTLQLADIKRIIKGTSTMYTVLNQKGILIREIDGYRWKESIPVTMKLARTVVEAVREHKFKHHKAVVKDCDNRDNILLNTIYGVEEEEEVVVAPALEEKIDKGCFVGDEVSVDEERASRPMVGVYLFWGAVKITLG